MSFDLDYFSFHAEDLGRSPELISKAREYAEKLISRNLPVIFSRQHLALYLNISNSDLDYLINSRAECYEHYEIKKRKGGTRSLVVPHANIRLAQHFILTEILQRVPVSSRAF